MSAEKVILYAIDPATHLAVPVLCDATGKLQIDMAGVDVTVDVDSADVGAAAAAADCAKGVTQHLDNGAGKRIAALGDASGHQQVDVVTLPAITGAVTTTGTVTEASASAIKTSLEIIDDWDASDHCNIRHLVATDDVVTVNEATSVVAETVQVNAAAVVAAAWSVIDATATGGKRYALVIVSCNKAHTIEFYGDSADFAAITTAHHIKDSKRTGCAENSATGGDSYLVPCAGHAYFGLRVQNNDAAVAATVTVAVSFFDA